MWEIWRKGLWDFCLWGCKDGQNRGVDEWGGGVQQSGCNLMDLYRHTHTHTHTHFFLPSRQFKPKSCLTRHFWLIFYISPLIQIKKASALSLSSLQFSDVKKKKKKRRSVWARRDAGQLLPDQSSSSSSSSSTSPPSHLLLLQLSVLKAFAWRVINRK